MAESDRRLSCKLHKQLEVEDDDGIDLNHPSDEGGSNSPNDKAACTIPSDDECRNASRSLNMSGVRTPTIQSASSSSETSPDEGSVQPTVQLQASITRKQTLTRTHALEGTSPPPESLMNQGVLSPSARLHPITNGGSSTTENLSPSGQTDSPSNGHKKLEESSSLLLASHKISSDSGHGTMDTTDAGSDTSVLSRDSSLENSATSSMYRDSSGVDIPRFIRETMLKSAKDKRTVLAYERQLIDFCRNESMHVLTLAEASSYDRMIAHRLSAFMGLEHNVDSTGKSVIINKTDNMRIVKITDTIKLDESDQDTKKKILKKPASLDEKHSRSASKGQFGSHRAKSLEERQQRYSEARERIFKDGECDSEGYRLSANYMPKIHQQRSLDSAQLHQARYSPSSASPVAPPLLLSGQQHHQHLLHPPRWASTDSSHGRSADTWGFSMSGLRTLCAWWISQYSQGAADLRASTMIKSNSYGGVGSDPSSFPGLARNEPYPLVVSNYNECSKDSGITLYSSGQPPPPLPAPACSNPNVRLTNSHQASTPSDDRPESHGSAAAQQQAFAYLVSSDYTSIPLGSLIIDPSTMQPHVNADGSVYRFDPSCPPPFMAHSTPSSSLTYQMENMSISSVPGPETGQVVFSHPHASATPQAIHFPQYYPGLPPGSHPSQQAGPLHLVTYAPSTALTPAGQGNPHGHPGAISQFIQAASPVEIQGQTTVPMPTIGVPGMAQQQPHNPATAFVLSPVQQQYDINPPMIPAGGIMYAAPNPYPSEAYGLPLIQNPNHPVGPSTHQLVQYSLSPYSQTSNPQNIAPHQQIFIPHSSSTAPAYFTVQQPTAVGRHQSNPTPPPALPPQHPQPGFAVAQIPQPLLHQHQQKMNPQILQPHQQQQQHQQTLMYSPSHALSSSLAGQPMAFPVPVSSNISYSTSSAATSQISANGGGSKSGTLSNLKPGHPPPPPPFALIQSSPPPSHHHHHHQSPSQPPSSVPVQLQHHNHLVSGTCNSAGGNTSVPQQTPPAHQLTYSPLAGNNQHLHHPQSLNIGSSPNRPSVIPASTSASPSPSAGYVAYQQMRPPGPGSAATALLQPSQQLNPYQLLRPAVPVNPSALQQRLASLQMSNPSGQHSYSKTSYYQHKKGPKRGNSIEPKDSTEDVAASSTGSSGQHLPHTVTLMPPVPTAPPQSYHQQQPVILAPLLPPAGMMPHNPHISSAPAGHR